jgi:hypothetical protein
LRTVPLTALCLSPRALPGGPQTSREPNLAAASRCRSQSGEGLIHEAQDCRGVGNWLLPSEPVNFSAGFGQRCPGREQVAACFGDPSEIEMA